MGLGYEIFIHGDEFYFRNNVITQYKKFDARNLFMC